jgi:hypothetical protein
MCLLTLVPAGYIYGDVTFKSSSVNLSRATLTGKLLRQNDVVWEKAIEEGSATVNVTINRVQIDEAFTELSGGIGAKIDSNFSGEIRQLLPYNDHAGAAYLIARKVGSYEYERKRNGKWEETESSFLLPFGYRSSDDLLSYFSFRDSENVLHVVTNQRYSAQKEYKYTYFWDKVENGVVSRFPKMLAGNGVSDLQSFVDLDGCPHVTIIFNGGVSCEYAEQKDGSWQEVKDGVLSKILMKSRHVQLERIHSFVDTDGFVHVLSSYQDGGCREYVQQEDGNWREIVNGIALLFSAAHPNVSMQALYSFVDQHYMLHTIVSSRNGWCEYVQQKNGSWKEVSDGFIANLPKMRGPFLNASTFFVDQDGVAHIIYQQGKCHEYVARAKTVKGIAVRKRARETSAVEIQRENPPSDFVQNEKVLLWEKYPYVVGHKKVSEKAAFNDRGYIAPERRFEYDKDNIDIVEKAFILNTQNQICFYEAEPGWRGKFKPEKINDETIFLQDGRAVSAKDGAILVWDFKNKTVKILTGGQRDEQVMRLAVSNSGLIASGAFSGNVKVWDIKNGVVSSFRVAYYPLLSLLSFFPDNRLVVGYKNYYYESKGVHPAFAEEYPRKKKFEEKWWRRTEAYTILDLVSYIPIIQEMGLIDRDPRLDLWDTGSVCAIAPLDNEQFLTGYEFGVIRLWDLRQKRVFTIQAWDEEDTLSKAKYESITSLVPLSGTSFISSERDVVKLWDLKNNSVMLAKMKNEIERIIPLRDGRLLIRNQDQSYGIIDHRFKKIVHLNNMYGQPLSLLPDGKVLMQMKDQTIESVNIEIEKVSEEGVLGAA